MGGAKPSLARYDLGIGSLHAFVPYGASNSSVRTRVLHWLERVGTGVVHGPGWPASDVPSDATALVLRNMRKFTRGGCEAALLERAACGIYELDDGLPWDDGRLPDLGRWWKRPWRRQLVAERAAAAADRLIVGNEVLAEWASTRCNDVRIIPTCVEPSDYRVKDHFAVGARPTIGWIGSPATEHFLVGIADSLRTLHSKHGAVVEMISGPGAVAAELAGFTTRVAWTEAEAFQRPASWDVGIMPLADGVYERAKCGYKLLQYAAAGLPAVGSPVGVNASILQQMDALPATSPGEWVEAIDELLTEVDSRRRARSARGREVAMAYSYDRWEPDWRDAVGLT